MSTVHVVGAGLAGLACAVRLAGVGRPVVLYDMAAQAGGRCRSLFDGRLGRRIDNGNHLLLGSNQAVLRYLDAVGARGALVGPSRPAFPFVELESGRRWTLRPNHGPVPWWVLSAARRVAESRPWDYLATIRLAVASAEATVADCFDRRTLLFRRFWKPLAVAALNAAPEEGAARLLWPVVRSTFLTAGDAAQPYIARDGLSATFVEPALAKLRAAGVEVRFGSRLCALRSEAARVVALAFTGEEVSLGREDAVVLAVPPASASELVPGLETPADSRAILNVHYRLDAPPRWPFAAPFVGLVGGLAHWLFVRGDIVSATVSAADALITRPADALATALWRDVARALGLGHARVPPFRVVKERRATFAQTPAACARRARARTRFVNLVLAGDWTDTGLPATLEGAARSGERAARLEAAR
ncbi:MAG: hydroxysqualene dehydroxylase HpnE [Alphaproteobacteria bacterium]